MDSVGGGGPICSVLQVLISNHKWGTPMGREEVISRASVDDKQDAKEAYEELASHTYLFVKSNPSRGMMIDSSHFEELADHLYHQCGWGAIAIRSRLKHYEGWQNHDWA